MCLGSCSENCGETRSVFRRVWRARISPKMSQARGPNNHQRIGLYQSSHHDVHEFFDLPSLLSNSYEARKSAPLVWEYVEEGASTRIAS